MGNFYTSYTLRGPSQRSVVAALAGRSAFVTPPQDGCVVVLDEKSEEQNQEVISGLASQLSQRLACPVLAALNHGENILWYRLYQSGMLTDEYDRRRVTLMRRLNHRTRLAAPHECSAACSRQPTWRRGKAFCASRPSMTTATPRCTAQTGSLSNVPPETHNVGQRRSPTESASRAILIAHITTARVDQPHGL